MTSLVNGTLKMNDPKYWDRAWELEDNPRENPYIWRVFQQIAGTVKPKIVVDFGCGFTTLSEWVRLVVPEVKFVGVDHSHNAIDMSSQRNPWATWRQVEDVRDTELPSLYADLTVCNSVLEHMPDVESAYKVLDEMWRVTSTPGVMAVCVPRMMHYREHSLTYDWDALIGMMSGYQTDGDNPNPVIAYSNVEMSRMVAAIHKV